VLSGLISTNSAPTERAIMGIVAAGWTIAEVPITSINRASEAASIDISRATLLSGSPNQITSGLARVPQSWQCGKCSGGWTLKSSHTA
jgi:hypothetical protein